MADTYQRSKELWKSACNTSERDFERRQIQEETMEKAEGASKGRGDEREKAGDKVEAGEKRAELLETAKIPGEDKKEIAPTEGDAKEKKNPSGKADAATKGQGDERDKAGSTKEAGEKRAIVEKADGECSPEEMAKKMAKEKIAKAFDEDEKLNYVIEKSSGMKYFYPEQVALVKGLLNKKVDAIAAELGLDKALVKEVITELIKAFPKKFLEKQEEKKEEKKE
jgi:hypothetical protein